MKTSSIGYLVPTEPSSTSKLYGTSLLATARAMDLLIISS
jgi:hypothetical protein